MIKRVYIGKVKFHSVADDIVSRSDKTVISFLGIPLYTKYYCNKVSFAKNAFKKKGKPIGFTKE